MSEKRKRENEKPACKYGGKCYRKNPTHLETYAHPEKSESQEQKRIKIDESKEGMTFGAESKSERIRNVPYLLTKVRSIPGRFNDSKVAIGLRDILSSKMGDLQASAQFSYMFDIPWLIEHYPRDKRSKPLLIVHGDEKPEKKHELYEEAEPFPNVKLFQAKLPISFGTHHSKMMLLLYTEGLRVVITTANLIPSDWDQKTQGVWMSPLFPKYLQESQSKPEGSEFQNDLMDYLHQYGPGPLTQWKQHIAQHDMSKARVRLLASVPGRHTGINRDKWGHMKLRKILQEHGKFDDVESWPVIGQFSSIGVLGPDKSKWLCAEWLKSLTSSTNTKQSGDHHPSLHLIFPTVEDVRTSLEGYVAGASLPYRWQTAAKQPYLKDFFCCWKSECLGRSRASPHLKSYTRISPDLTKAAWFIMTSANLSKAAWGALEKDGSQLMIRSYEIGVLFLPEDLDSSEKFFHLSEDQAQSNSVVLKLPFDVPVVPYTNEDQPWIWDRQYNRPDIHGHCWKP